MITLKPTHFGRKGHGTATIAPTWISNGHWAIRRDTVANAYAFATADTAAAFLGCRPTGDRVRELPDETIARAVLPYHDDRRMVAYTITPIVIESAETDWRILTGEDGTIAALDVDYYTTLGFSVGQTLFGRSDLVLVDAPIMADVTRACMPMRLSAKTVGPLAETMNTIARAIDHVVSTDVRRAS